MFIENSCCSLSNIFVRESEGEKKEKDGSHPSGNADAAATIQTSIERMLSLIELISIKFQKQFRSNQAAKNCEYERKRFSSSVLLCANCCCRCLRLPSIESKVN
jgi:hypothetical protein